MAKIFRKLQKKPKPPSQDYSGSGRNTRLGSGSIRSPVNEFDDEYEIDPQLARMGSGRFNLTTDNTDTICSVFGTDSNSGTFSSQGTSNQRITSYNFSQQNAVDTIESNRRSQSMIGYDIPVPSSPTKKATVVLDDYSDPIDIRKALETDDGYKDGPLQSGKPFGQPPEDDYSVPYDPQRMKERRMNNGTAATKRPSYHGPPMRCNEYPEPIAPPPPVAHVKTHHNGLTLENGRLSPKEPGPFKNNNLHVIIPPSTVSLHNAPTLHLKEHQTIQEEEPQKLQSTPVNDRRPRAEYDEPWEWQARRNMLAQAKEEATSPTADMPRSRSRSDVAGLNMGQRPTPETDNRPQTEYDEPWEWKQRNRAALQGNKDVSQMSRSSSCSNKPSTNLRLEIRPKPDPVGEYVEPNKPLQEQGWYHGKLSRCDAEKKLKSCREGSYLVRQSESSAKDFSLSLKSAKGYMHMKIVLHQEGYILGEFSKPFKSISYVISHYSLHKLNIKGAEHMMLLYAVHDNLL